MDGASQAAMDGEKRPLTWEAGPPTEQLLYTIPSLLPQQNAP